MVSQTSTEKSKRSSPRYWVEIKGKLYARLQYKADDGKYKVKYKAITDKRTARSAVEEMRRELDIHGQEMLTSDKMTFSELAKSYEAKMSPAVFENGIKISGRKSSIDWLVNSLVDYFGAKQIRSIKPRDLETFKNFKSNGITRRGEKRKIASVNRELEVLRAMFNFALQNEWIIKNPFTLTKGMISKAAEVERDRILSFDEEKRLLAVCTGKRAHLNGLFICALDTAMRRGEIFKMKWADVNFASGEINIPQANSKTEDARIVGITPRLRKELEILWEVSPKDKSMLVFGITNTIKTSFHSACREAGITDFRFHDCRHTATTRMIASGSPHTEVMKITGHTQLKTFLRYLNITTETANKVASRLNDYLAGRQQLVIAEISDQVN
jgi:integrase